ncbi:pentatricopeptide repeat-containing protein At2g20710, mitochondrial-like [Argentina anserina]|uniref:pentatricopeptide repeat-containing protein At2g20710, mitochondrial-like n=1 Tax=Argentina anserina TaxID=57926 RepID=UPI0021765FC4|nr:pentatricopeptide repeat-containing protein At2g20710, mitochondrial-like [Potentilla anserina]
MMKLSHFNSLFSRPTLGSARRDLSLHTTAAANAHRRSWRGSLNGLYRRISRSDPKASALPILDKWVHQGRPVDKDGLVTIVKELRHYKDYKQALEVSMWMSDKRYIELLPADIAVRLDLIAKVHGTEQAENYFYNIPKKLKVLEVYSALLNCYGRAKQLDKAEATMQKMRDLGIAKTSLQYNILLNLYYKTGNKEKFHSLIREMEENGIGIDRFTIGIKLSAAAAASDLEGIEKIVAEWQSVPGSPLDWVNYAVAANGYTKIGAVDKASEMLQRSEEQIPSSKRQRPAYEYLMTQYAVLGKKADTLRLWKCYKEHMKIYNRGYVCVMTSLSKFDDIESVEKVFEEWESKHLNYDTRIPNTLIGAYARNGYLDKAEALMSRIRLKDQKPNPTAWNHMAKGYLHQGEIEKALDAATKAISAAQPGWIPDKDVVAACLEYFKSKTDLKGAEDFIKLLGGKNIIPVNVQERLLSHIKNENWTSVVGEMEWDFPKGDEEETSELTEMEIGQ